MEREADIYQKTDVEHVLNGLGETLWVEDELEVVHGSSSILLELTDQTAEGLTDHLLRSVQLCGVGVLPVLVDVEGGGLSQSSLGVPHPASPGWLLLLCLSWLAGDGSEEEGEGWASPELAGEAGAELDKAP